MRIAYTENETRIIADAYARLVAAEAAGIKLNKAQLYRDIAPLLNNRTRGAVEAKWMNLSHVALVNGMLPGLVNGYVAGYKPAPNGAKALHDALIVALYRNRETRIGAGQ